MLAMSITGFDPEATSRLPRRPNMVQPLSKHSVEPLRCLVLSQGARMRRRDFLGAVGGVAALPFEVRAQPGELRHSAALQRQHLDNQATGRFAA